MIPLSVRPAWPERITGRGFLLILALSAALALSACTGPGPFGPESSGRDGLIRTLDRFEAGTKWRNWYSLLDAFYLKDHADEVRKKFGSDLEKWFLSDRATAALLSGKFGAPRHLCVLALRVKHLSPSFSPHFMVYYRVQKESCREQIDARVKALAEGRMEWGYQRKQRRWVHLRSLG
jgi:hypothetical protein